MEGFLFSMTSTLSLLFIDMYYIFIMRPWSEQPGEDLGISYVHFCK